MYADEFVIRYMLIYQLNFWLVICIAENLIWATLKAALYRAVLGPWL